MPKSGLVQVYLSGQEVPSLYITYYRPVPHAGALACMIAKKQPQMEGTQDTLMANKRRVSENIGKQVGQKHGPTNV